MNEMSAFSRFFVNLFARRNSRRRYQWLSANLHLPPHANCLEIGCGNGDFAARVVSGLAPERYLATDLDPRQLEVAGRNLAKRYPQGIPKALELRTADMLGLPFPDASFDAVFAFNVLHHTSAEHHDSTNLPRALAEIHRVLRPGGNFAYAEFLHKDLIRAWLSERGYTIAATRQRRRGEIVLAIKASANQPTSSSKA
jgi:ubiquinone/menaquinone biosynthesis C-methylase UbiE